jgi:hypothetical protein
LGWLLHGARLVSPLETPTLPASPRRTLGVGRVEQDSAGRRVELSVRRARPACTGACTGIRHAKANADDALGRSSRGAAAASADTSQRDTCSRGERDVEVTCANGPRQRPPLTAQAPPRRRRSAARAEALAQPGGSLFITSGTGELPFSREDASLASQRLQAASALRFLSFKTLLALISCREGSWNACGRAAAGYGGLTWPILTKGS